MMKTYKAYYKSPLNNVSPDDVELGLDTAALVTADPASALLSVNDSFVAAGNPESNYILFSGLTADSTTVYFNRVSRDGILTGFQVEAIPEPGTGLLIAIGAGGLLLCRRRRV